MDNIDKAEALQKLGDLGIKKKRVEHGKIVALAKAKDKSQKDKQEILSRYNEQLNNIDAEILVLQRVVY